MRRRAFLAGTAATLSLLSGCFEKGPGFEILNETSVDRRVAFRVTDMSTEETVVDGEVSVPANEEREYGNLIRDAVGGGPVRIWADTPAQPETSATFEDYTRNYRLDVTIETDEITVGGAIV